MNRCQQLIVHPGPARARPPRAGTHVLYAARGTLAPTLQLRHPSGIQPYNGAGAYVREPTACGEALVLAPR